MKADSGTGYHQGVKRESLERQAGHSSRSLWEKYPHGVTWVSELDPALSAELLW